MKHLCDLSQNKLKWLMQFPICVNLKLDFSAIMLSKCRYFGREGKDEIDEIKMAAMSSYSRPIRRLNKNCAKIPNNIECYMEYYLDGMPTIVRYPRYMNGTIVLSYIKENDKIIMPNNSKTLNCADELIVLRPPIIREGNLTDEDKLVLLDDSLSNTEKLELVFPVPDYFNNYIEGGHEGVCIYFDCPDGAEVYKLVNESFTEIIKSKKASSDTSVHRFVYSSLLEIYKSVDVTNSRKIRSFYDIMDLAEIMSKIEGLDKLSHSGSLVSLEMLPDKATILTNTNPVMHDIIRILLLAFRKKRVRTMPKHGLTSEVKELINSLIP